MITRAVASIVYGEPRLKHDVDLVMELNVDDKILIKNGVEKFAEINYANTMRNV